MGFFFGKKNQFLAPEFEILGENFPTVENPTVENPVLNRVQPI